MIAAAKLLLADTVSKVCAAFSAGDMFLNNILPDRLLYYFLLH
jgi:hypothetical protein